MNKQRTTVTTYDRGYLHVEADSAFAAVCRAHCLLAVTHDDAFRIIDFMPASTQVWTRGRYDHLLECVGEWRVPVTYAMSGEDVPADVMRAWMAFPWFLDFRYLPAAQEQLEVAA